MIYKYPFFSECKHTPSPWLLPEVQIMHCGIFRCEILTQCVDESPTSLLEKQFYFRGFNYPPFVVRAKSAEECERNTSDHNTNQPERRKCKPSP